MVIKTNISTSYNTEAACLVDTDVSTGFADVAIVDNTKRRVVQ